MRASAAYAMNGSAVPSATAFVARAASAVLQPAVRVAGTAFDSPRTRAAIASALESRPAKQVVADFFDSGLFDELVVRLLESRALWVLVEEIAQSPAVTAAISRQGFSFADQVGEEVRSRSRKADRWLELAASRLSRSREHPTHGEKQSPGAGR